MIEFAAGFGLCAAIWICWHFGFIQPKLNALKDAARAKAAQVEADVKARL